MGAERPPNLILVGLPGSGKTTVGRALAARLNREFIDFDEVIVQQEGMSVADIFGSKGEPYFRSLERKLTGEVASRSGLVLAPGGGWMANPDLVRMVRPPALVVYLRITPEGAMRRLGEQRQARPLLMGPDPLSRLRILVAKRGAFYETADAVIDVETLTPQGVIDSILELTRKESAP
ncbi:MAG TPA: shikimate kinase [Gemmatimonadaceae bacterium]